jgi:hypothetical protein
LISARIDCITLISNSPLAAKPAPNAYNSV